MKTRSNIAQWINSRFIEGMTKAFFRIDIRGNELSKWRYSLQNAVSRQSKNGYFVVQIHEVEYWLIPKMVEYGSHSIHQD